MNDQKPKTTELDKEEAPILGSWSRIYLWLIILNVLFVVLFYLFMRIYTT